MTRLHVQKWRYGLHIFIISAVVSFTYLPLYSRVKSCPCALGVYQRRCGHSSKNKMSARIGNWELIIPTHALIPSQPVEYSLWWLRYASTNSSKCSQHLLFLYKTVRLQKTSLLIKPFKNPRFALCTTSFNIQKFCVLPTHCIYVFCVDLRTNSDYLSIQQ